MQPCQDPLPGPEPLPPGYIIYPPGPRPPVPQPPWHSPLSMSSPSPVPDSPALVQCQENVRLAAMSLASRWKKPSPRMALRTAKGGGIREPGWGRSGTG
jgi:hypothetical protein